MDFKSKDQSKTLGDIWELHNDIVCQNIFKNHSY